MHAYELDELLKTQAQSGKHWLEFLRVPDLSVGVYVLPKGDLDPQGPHSEDEVYYVIAGRAQIRVADETRPVGPGSVVYVARGVEHRFFDITDSLTVLVFFAPAEYSQAAVS